jgi:hypothetical protein
MLTLKHVILSLAVVVAAILGSVATASASAAAPYCGITWGSLPKVHDASSQALLLDPRTGQHDCFDRVVFEFQGPATGYSVSYADQVLTDGKGDPLSIAGGAKLRVGLRDSASQTSYSHIPGDHVAKLNGYRTIRDVVYGGGFEGYSTFGVGTRARLPFRVFTLAGPGDHSRIVVDVAHKWS